MEAKILKFGNSLGVRITQKYAAKLNFKKDSYIKMESEGNRLIISPKVSELDLLLDKITDKNRHGEVFDDNKSLGNEAW